MKIQISTESITLINNVCFPEQIKNINAHAYLNGLSDDPFYACNLGDILKKHRLWCEKLSRVEPFYAVKCNPTDIVVKILAKLNIGFDCASRGEISQILAAGVSPDRIIYANPCKPSSHLSYAEVNHIKMMTFDSTTELGKIAVYHPSSELILRIFVGATSARCPLGLKFGASMEDVSELLNTAQSLNLNVIGVSFHVGSGCFDADAYRAAIILSNSVFDIAASMGIKLTLLDIGGGFPGNLDTPDRMHFFDNVCNTINECLDQYFPPERQVRIIGEPGRYYVSSAFQLALSVTSIRQNRVPEGEKASFSYFLNDGVYCSLNCIIFDHYIGEHYILDDHHTPSINVDVETFQSVFWGPTCDSMDKILDNFCVRKLNVGDCVVFKHMGAYTMAAGSNFNGFPKPYITYFCSFEDWQHISPLLLDSSSEVHFDSNSFVSSPQSLPAIDTCYHNNIK